MKGDNDKIVEGERAVSPVIGVILMVAITVILAAVIGTFVLDLGQDVGESAPQASLSIDSSVSSDQFTISHSGGDSLISTRSRVVITNESSGNSITWDEGTSEDTFSVGEDVDFNVGTSGTPSGWSLSASSTDFSGGLQSGVQYTITVIDTESSKIIFETSIVP